MDRCTSEILAPALLVFGADTEKTVYFWRAVWQEVGKGLESDSIPMILIIDVIALWKTSSPSVPSTETAYVMPCPGNCCCAISFGGFVLPVKWCRVWLTKVALNQWCSLVGQGSVVALRVVAKCRQSVLRPSCRFSWCLNPETQCFPCN